MQITLLGSEVKRARHLLSIRVYYSYRENARNLTKDFHSRYNIAITYKTVGGESMLLWRENMQIPKEEQARKMRKERKNIIRKNSFYIAGTGKTMADYVESPENRRAAGISCR